MSKDTMPMFVISQDAMSHCRLPDNPDIHTADWSCPCADCRKAVPLPDQETMASFCHVSVVRRMVDEAAEDMERKTGRSRYILPVWQNMEALAYGTRILGNGGYPEPGRYCVEKLDELRYLDFDLLSHPLIRAVTETIPYYRDKELVLEVESPFTVLSGLMNPMDLYLCFEKEGVLLRWILHNIADATAEYVRACVEAGCRTISLADPTGTMDMVGEEYYKDYCGQAEIRLMKQCQPYFDRIHVHICRKMVQSLLIAGLALKPVTLKQ